MDNLTENSKGANDDNFALDLDSISQNKDLHKLFKTVFKEVKLYADKQIKHIKKRAQIGQALSSEKNINKLLEMIVDEARDVTSADACTLYLMDSDEQHLKFEILQNATMKTRMGGTSGTEITLPKVPLYKEGKPNYSNVSSYVALTGETINISDVYEAVGFDFTGPRSYDAATGYRSKSMLVIPMVNHENDIIGVLQLLNAQDPETKSVIQFSPDYVDLVASLTSQAAVALTNAKLIQDLESLFYSFIKSIATAIDEKSPYTGGHIKRVVDLTELITEKINDAKEGSFKNVYFTEDEIKELRLAAWMHDVGKITTPEYVVDKATKLSKIKDDIDLIETRFCCIAQSIEIEHLKTKMELLTQKNKDEEIKKMDQTIFEELKALRQDYEFIKFCNNSGEFMSDEAINRIQKIANKQYYLYDKKLPYLTDDETLNLCIRKGTLTNEERKIIENHVTMTYKILKQLPFPKKLKHVPDYAAGHHERLDGTGYPKGLNAKQLPLQARIIAIADIFEALTAKDRPYREPMKLSKAIKIMGFMKNDHHIDPDIYDLFFGENFFLEYARKELKQEQIDMSFENKEN